MSVLAIRDWPVVKRFFSDEKEKSSQIKRDYTSYLFDSATDARYKSYALHICISRLANAIALCDFQTFVKNKKTKGSMWWLLNFEPNQNQNQTDFIYDVLHRMVFNYEDGALIVQTDDGQLIVAESFNLEEKAYKPNVYSNIIVKGNYMLRSIKLESEVIRLKLNNGKVKEIIDSVYEDYGKLISGTIRNYNRGNAVKLKLVIDSEFEQFKTKEIEKEDGSIVTEYDEILDELFTERYKAIFSDKDSLTPVESGLDLENIEFNRGNTKSGTITTRDITSTFEDILNMTADAFLIPRGIAKGDVADNEGMRRSLIDDAVRPIVENWQTEFNRKLYGKDKFLAGNKMKIQTNLIFTKDPVAFANAAEAYLRIGVYSVNDILEMLGEETIDEAWANEHYVTKNYQSIHESEKQIKSTVLKLEKALKTKGGWLGENST